jgi:hypothetical protein
MRKKTPQIERESLSPRAKNELIAKAKQEIEKARLKHELPHIFGFKPYQWTLDYWNSTKRMKFICAGNQLSKSSTQIRHCIDLMTDKQKWAKYFPKWMSEAKVPPVAWYIYPNKTKILEEWDKWEREFLPRGSMRDDPTYGWKVDRDKDGIPQVLRFFSGSSVWIKTWHQDLQAGTLAAAFIDEEIIESIWGEIAARVTRYDGIISMVFTATLNQPFFFQVIERRGMPDERFPHADKWQISMEYDCQFYADGTPSPWTPEEVARQKAKLGSETEINKRIHGRFQSNKGKRYPSFNRYMNIKSAGNIDRTWDFFGGVDVGTGGEDGHPAAISIVAVRPDYKKARVVRLWRGNHEENTNTTQILNRYIEMTRDLPMLKNYYDWHSKEFHLRASEAGVPFDKADKSRDFGIDLLNVLFKNQILDIDEGPFSDELAQELENSRNDERKQEAKDDLSDALRYSVSRISFDLSAITGEVAFYEPGKPKASRSLQDERMQSAEAQSNAAIKDQDDSYDFEDDFDLYNQLME